MLWFKSRISTKVNIEISPLEGSKLEVILELTTSGVDKDCVCVCVCVLSCVRFFMTPWTDNSPPGSSVHGIFQARMLEWVAISYCRFSPEPKDQTHISPALSPCLHVSMSHCLCVSMSPHCLLHWQVDSLPLTPPGKPEDCVLHFNLSKFRCGV